MRTSLSARSSHQATTAAMDTVVSIEVIADSAPDDVRAALQRALDWFAVVERVCGRFDPARRSKALFQHGRIRRRSLRFSTPGAEPM